MFSWPNSGVYAENITQIARGLKTENILRRVGRRENLIFRVDCWHKIDRKVNSGEDIVEKYETKHRNWRKDQNLIRSSFDESSPIFGSFRLKPYSLPNKKPLNY